MSSLTENHTMDLLYLLKQNFKPNYLTIQLRQFVLFIKLFLITKMKILKNTIHSNVLRGIEPDLAYKKVSGVSSQYTLWSGSLWYPVRSSLLKNKRFFSFLISKLMPAFSTVKLDVAKNHIS